MNGESDRRGGLPVAATLAALVAAGTGGYLLLSEPLHPLRHQEQITFTSPSNDTEIVEARLWQDPLQAIYADWHRVSLQVTGSMQMQRLPVLNLQLPPPTSSIGEHPAADIQGKGRLSIMAILTPASPYADDAEVRRRQRYALVAALTAERFLPHKENRLGYAYAPSFKFISEYNGTNEHRCIDPQHRDAAAQVSPAVRASAAPGTAEPASFELRAPGTILGGCVMLVGFEFFHRPAEASLPAEEAAATHREETSSRDTVLVLWLNENDFATNTLGRLNALFDHIEQKIGNAPGRKSTARIVLGPSSSSGLRRLYDDRCDDAQVSGNADQNLRCMGYLREHDTFVTLAGSVSANADTHQILSRGFPTMDPAGPHSCKLEGMTTLPPVEFVAAIDRFLDDGLSTKSQNELLKCVGKGRGDTTPIDPRQLESCLKSPPFNTIKDSAENWQAMVVDAAETVHHDWQAQQSVDAVMEDVRNDPEGVCTVLRSAHEYLDDGLVVPAGEVQKLSNCMDAPAADAQRGESWTRCLQQIEGIEDSDDTWFETAVQIAQRSAPTKSYRNLTQCVRLISPRATVPFEHLCDGAACRGTVDSLLRDEAEESTVCGPEDKSALKAAHGSDEEAPAEADDPPADTIADPSPLTDDETLASSSAQAEPMLLRSQMDFAAATGLRGRFHSVIATDDSSLDLVVKELLRRGINLCTDPGPIALITERDATYGRAMPDVLAKAIARQANCTAKIDRYNYLRGVDGEMPPGTLLRQEAIDLGQDAQRPLEGLNEQRRAEFSSGHEEEAAGGSQLDYVRRLADHIARRRTGGVLDTSGYKVIGILGTDVYDKQLILRALRERLPGVLFFTTDLDARLTDPDHYRWNRNLVVASSYGLRWADGGVVDMPPFRDSYQTAFFRAVQLAVSAQNPEGETPATFAAHATPEAPRLFEIGRSGAIDITEPPSDPTSTSSAMNEQILSAWASPTTGHRPPEGAVGWKQHAGGFFNKAGRALVVLAPMLILALALHYQMRHRLLQPREYGVRGVVVPKIGRAMAVAVTILCFAVLWYWDRNELEPWLLLEGISMMPTIMLQVSACVFSLVFLMLLYDADYRLALSSRRDGLPRSLCSKRLSEPARRVQQQPRESIRDWYRSLPSPDITPVRPLPADAIWLQYLSLSRLRARLLRIALPSLLAGLAVVLVVRFPGLNFLGRGTGLASAAIQAFAAFASLTLVMAMADVLRLAEVLAAALGRYEVRWRRTSKPTLDADEQVEESQRTMDYLVAVSKNITPLILLPFVVISLMVLARSSVFEGWRWTAPVVISYLAAAAYLLWRAYRFQREIGRTRDILLYRLRRLRQQHADDEQLVQRIQFALDDMRDVHEGAFVPWTRHPILQSIALPSSGVVLVWFIDTFF